MKDFIKLKASKVKEREEMQKLKIVENIVDGFSDELREEGMDKIWILVSDGVGVSVRLENWDTVSFLEAFGTLLKDKHYEDRAILFHNLKTLVGFIESHPDLYDFKI